MNGHHSSAPLGVKNGLGKVPIQPTPGAIRKPPNTKPKQKKSRGGCITCKDKRTKCDETKVCHPMYGDDKIDFVSHIA